MNRVRHGQLLKTEMILFSVNFQSFHHATSHAEYFLPSSFRYQEQTDSSMTNGNNNTTTSSSEFHEQSMTSSTSVEVNNSNLQRAMMQGQQQQQQQQQGGDTGSLKRSELESRSTIFLGLPLVGSKQLKKHNDATGRSFLSTLGNALLYLQLNKI